ncbi:hypothetical protein P3667_10985 [Vibrio parahaemolyticus]|nr:hypothetical protein [Vibrio parahaemolyticus]MDF5126810.1 hypothetical protein [Vibrio parahaemolyticus]MDF5269192.1 hypothetical protein [Vibrio parahaemolyticus]HCE2597951.1 hypothetical protein [Vibrio parahaemolyticus]
MMKVKELQEKLSKLDPELQLILSTEDEDVLNNQELFKLFDVQDISVIEAEPTRDAYRKPTLIIGKSEGSVKMAMVNISGDF